MKNKVLFFGLIPVLLLLGAVSPLSTASANSPGIDNYFVPPASPTSVKVDFLVISIPKIDVPTETFEVLAYLTLTWEDPAALALLPDTEDKQTFLDKSADISLQQIWFPIIQFTNQYTPRKVHNTMLIIERSRTNNGSETAIITYNERFLVTLLAVLDLTKFPFDSQDFRIGFKTFGLSDKDVFLEIGTIDFFRYKSLNETETELHDSVFFAYQDNCLPIEWENGVISYHILEITSEAAQIPYQSIEIIISAQHNASFYIWKILLPLLLIVAISCVAFWVPGEGIGTRNYVSMFGFLTAVTFSFYVVNYLPRMSGLTFLDGAITGAYIFIASSVIVNVTAHLLIKHQKNYVVHKIDRVCRWIFPLGYVLFCAIWILAILL